MLEANQNLKLLFEYFQCLHFYNPKFLYNKVEVEVYYVKSTIGNIVMIFLVNGLFDSKISNKLKLEEKIRSIQEEVPFVKFVSLFIT